VRIYSEMNRREHWGARHRRFLGHKFAVGAGLLRSQVPKCKPRKVRMVRVGKRKLDRDNLAGGFKAVLDEVSGWMGWDDGDESVAIEYEQELDDHFCARVEITI